MDRRISAVAWLLLSPVAMVAQEAERSIQDILGGVRKRADDAKQDDQRRGLQLLQRAEHARRAGRVDEALDLASKAQQRFPESVEISRTVADLQAERRSRRAQAAFLEEAVEALEEAVAYAARLIMEDRRAEAKELVVAVRQLVSEFPAGVELASIRAAADKLLSEVANQPTADQVEQVPVLPRLLPEPLSPSEMRLLLARRITLEWRGEPLSNAFLVIQNETGLAIKLDAHLERLGVFDQVPADLRISNAPVERLLRMVTDMVGAAYVLIDGEVLITTKANALALAVSRPQVRAEPLVPRRPPPPAPLLPTPPPAKAAGYLISGQALREHVGELLKASAGR